MRFIVLADILSEHVIFPGYTLVSFEQNETCLDHDLWNQKSSAKTFVVESECSRKQTFAELLVGSKTVPMYQRPLVSATGVAPSPVDGVAIDAN